MEPDRSHPPHLPPDPPQAGGPLSTWQQAISPQQLQQQQAWQQQMLERELASTRAELEAMQELLQELPEIFERKFQQRLQPLLAHQQRLLSENEGLRSQMRLLRPADPAPADVGSGTAAPVPYSPTPESTAVPPPTAAAPFTSPAATNPPEAPSRPPLQWTPLQPQAGSTRPAASPPAPEAGKGPTPGNTAVAADTTPLLPQLPQRPRIPQAVRHAFGLGRRNRKALSRRNDDGPPTDGSEDPTRK
ncbi:hypothetical protein [Synechococcus sp. CS-1328]|uniref:hypothetical protein n=1 Tax=Synechococcus sp. CS-1328 TaxID=2847976 RepID=UPI00223B9972|nr:hypothetical protein [Synechococcus sp. CS-1328]MCT0224312.1 hypothetical protein [Synechococcus sp. CS-1328]